MEGGTGTKARTVLLSGWQALTLRASLPKLGMGPLVQDMNTRPSFSESRF